MTKPELYLSLDVETDGPAPGLNSMLSLGAAAFRPGESKEFAWFYAKLAPLANARQDPDTMAWWKTQPEAWDEVNDDPEPPFTVMTDLSSWLYHTSEHRRFDWVPAAWPAAFDFSFVNYYTHLYLGSNPLGYACLDLRSYAVGLAHRSYNGLSEKQVNNLAGKVDREGLRPHVAVDDAKGQGRLLMQMMRQVVE